MYHLQAFFEVYKRFALAEKYRAVRREIGRDVTALVDMWARLEEIGRKPEMYATIPVKIASNGHDAIVTVPISSIPTLRLTPTNHALLVFPLVSHEAPTEVEPKHA